MIRNLKGMAKMVEYCLRNYPEARDSDQVLFNAIIINFYKEHTMDLNEILGRDAEKPDYIMRLTSSYNLPSTEHVFRVRRRLQNPRPKDNYYGIYRPTKKEVLIRRGWMEEDIRRFIGSDPEMRTIYY